MSLVKRESSTAVEIATLLGDSVVGVHHVTTKQAQTLTKPTLAMLAAGGVSLAVASVAWLGSIHIASQNQLALAAWVARKKPTWSFRPDMMNLTLDWVALIALVAGMVGLVAGLWRFRREREATRSFRIGTAATVEQPVLGAPSTEFALVEQHADGFVLNLAAGMTVTAAPGQAEARVESNQVVPLDATARYRVRAGQTSFLISATSLPAPSLAAGFARFESAGAIMVAASALVHIGAIFFMTMAGEDGRATAADGDDSEALSVRLATSAQETTPPEKAPDSDDGAAGDSAGGKAMALAEGLAGTAESTATNRKIAVKRMSETATIAKQDAINAAREYGILGAAAFHQNAFTAIASTSDITSGWDDMNFHGGLDGEPGDQAGGFGYGRKGIGPGGDGTGWGTVGAGPFGTIGDGPGTGGWGTCKSGNCGNGPARRHKADVPTATIGSATINGDLDRATIRRYIMRSYSTITYCYEKQLLANKNLAGTVVAQFMIAPNGSVSASTASGVHAEVAQCVARVIKTISFPAPRGGAGVQVSYPLTFRTSS